MTKTHDNHRQRVAELSAALVECERLRKCENRQTAECITRMRAAVKAAQVATQRAEVAEATIKKLEQQLLDAKPNAHNCAACINPECSAADKHRITFCDAFMGADYYDDKEPG